MRRTKELLNGLVSPEKLPPSGDKNEDQQQQPPIYPCEEEQPPPPQQGFVLASNLTTLSDDIFLDKDSREPEISFLVLQHTPPHKDAASTHKDNTLGWDRAVQAQLNNLKLWLELQLTALNKKINAIMEKQRRHRKVYQDSASTLEMEEKDNCLMPMPTTRPQVLQAKAPLVKVPLALLLQGQSPLVQCK